MENTGQKLVPTFDENSVKREINRSKQTHYVYILCRPDGRPFYVGKGVGNRFLHHEAEARNLSTKSHKLNVIRSIWRDGLRVGYFIDSFFWLESEAHSRERELIASFGRHDLRTGPLTNQTDGGEGASNPSQESRNRRAATLGGAANDPERRLINEFFNSISGDQDSVPVKPYGARKLVPLTPHPSPRKPSPRMAKALVAACAGAGILMEPGCLIPREFSMQGARYVIENGVGRDMLKAGLVTLKEIGVAPEKEKLVLTFAGFNHVKNTIGIDRLVDLGVIEPDKGEHL